MSGSPVCGVCVLNRLLELTLVRPLMLMATMLLVSLPASAVLDVDISKGVEDALAIAVVPFGWEGAAKFAPEDVAQIVETDLKRSGQFSPLPIAQMISTPSDVSQVNFGDWRKLQVDNLVIGKLRQDATGDYVVQFQLFDVLRNKQLAGYSFPARAQDLRAISHHIADLIYEKLLAVRGAFGTRIAYVTAKGPVKKRVYELLVADSDGHNDLSVLESPKPIMSPAWSPDGRQLAYVSFEKGAGHVYVQNLDTGRRRVIAAHPGINGAPAWSKDGKMMALTLSKDGNPEVYVFDLRSQRLQRLTRHRAIDTEPAFSPDGRWVYFTSDRGGRPQIYKVDLNGGRPSRVSFDGKYNARPSVSSDGRFLAMVHSEGKRSDGGKGFTIAVMDLDNGALQVLSDGPLDETPSFSPNGAMVLYATQRGGRSFLSAVSVDGRVKQSLRVSSADVREPAWSPFLGQQ